MVRPPNIKRVALGVAYHGRNYFGWQKQPHIDKPTVQACVESALSRVIGHDCQLNVICAGRTDKGVHATGQVIHFDTPVARNLRAWVEGTNSYLPKDIVIQWSQFVEDDFHARLSAIERHYRYTIYNHRVPSPLWCDLAVWFPQPLDVNLMQQAGNYLLGEQDFSSFRASHCQSRTTWRKVKRVSIVRDSSQPHFIHIDICANAFLYHMVRNIVGMLVIVGQKKRPAEWAADVLAARDRQVAAPTAPPQGLCLTSVVYQEQFRFANRNR